MEFWIPTGALIFCTDCYRELASYIEVEGWLELPIRFIYAGLDAVVFGLL